jgi:hypothetical protein
MFNMSNDPKQYLKGTHEFMTDENLSDKLPNAKINDLLLKYGNGGLFRFMVNPETGKMEDDRRKLPIRFAITRPGLKTDEKLQVTRARRLIELQANAIETALHITAPLEWLEFLEETKTASGFDLEFAFHFRSVRDQTFSKWFARSSIQFADTTSTKVRFSFDRDGRFQELDVVETGSLVEPFSAADGFYKYVRDLLASKDEEKQLAEFDRRIEKLTGKLQPQLVLEIYLQSCQQRR